MGERMDKRIRFYIYWILGLVFLGACAPGDERGRIHRDESF